MLLLVLSKLLVGGGRSVISEDGNSGGCFGLVMVQLIGELIGRWR